MSLKADDIHFPSGRTLLYHSRCESEESQMFKKEPEWSSRCPSFLAGESVKDGQKHGNIKQHTATNRPNKKDLGSLLKKWEHADLIPSTPTIWSRAPDPGSGLSWNSSVKARRLRLPHRRTSAKCSARLNRIRFWLFRESRDTTNPMWMSSVDAQRIHRCLKQQGKSLYEVENLKGSSWKWATINLSVVNLWTQSITRRPGEEGIKMSDKQKEI